jgi:DNA-binding NtrC family response regulator
MNCPGVPGTFLEDVFFAPAKAELTRSLSVKTGSVSLARSGTLFFDEISELDLPLQSKLLHFLQDGQFHATGVSTAQKVSARVVCATHRQLQAQVENGLFRQDLLFPLRNVR